MERAHDRKPLRRSAIVLIVVGATLLVGRLAPAGETLNVYGPGGPYPAMREAAAVFGGHHRVTVTVTAGPTGAWLDRAKGDADAVYSGAEFMMTNLVAAMEGRILEETVTPLYLRPSAILVRGGNPKLIRGFPDLLRPGVNVLVVQGAGQTGLWEDMAGKRGDIGTVRAFRRNIRGTAANSAEAKRRWLEDESLDAWVIWNIWHVSNPDIADLVPVGDDHVIYRDCGIALTQDGAGKPLARQFVRFLESADGQRIFAKWGWITP